LVKAWGYCSIYGKFVQGENFNRGKFYEDDTGAGCAQKMKIKSSEFSVFPEFSVDGSGFLMQNG
jgi:hypothetical protein